MGAVYGQSIRDFYKQSTQRGFARDFQFRVTTFRVNGVSLGPDNLVFLKTANLPGKTISTTTAPFMGLDFQIPGTVKFEGNNNWQVTFYCTQDYDLRKFLEDMMRVTFDERTSRGNMEPRDLHSNLIQISLIDDQLQEVRVYSLLGAFITKIEETTYDLTKSGGIQEVKATLAYQYWEPGFDSGVSFGLGIGGLNLANGVAGALEGVADNLVNTATQAVTNEVGNIVNGLFKG